MLLLGPGGTRGIGGVDRKGKETRERIVRETGI